MHPITLISGDDDFEIRRTAQQLVREFEEANPEGEVEVIDADNRSDVSPGELIQQLVFSLDTPSLFMQKKLIRLKQCSFLNPDAEKSGGKKKKSEPEPFDRLLNRLKEPWPDDMVLLIDGVNIDRRRTLYKNLEKSGVHIVFCPKPDPNDRAYGQIMAKRIQDAFVNADVQITRDAVDCLREMLGSDSERIQSELDKLITYAGEHGRINRKDCLDVCSHTPEVLNWALSNALMDQDVNSALTALDELIARQESERSSGIEIGLLATLSGAFQGLVKTRAAVRELGINPLKVNPRTFDHIEESLKTAFPRNPLIAMHPYRAFKMVEQSNRFSDVQLVRILNAVLKTNVELVTGIEQPRLALERLILQICLPESRLR